MKRKTNLFYTSGQDSKFITFSNYTESLTGNFLSTDTKLYPSRFIALHIKGLNNDTKKHLIKYLARYYESKLAVLRDHYVETNENAEKYVLPLNYLIEALLRITNIDENGVEWSYKIPTTTDDQGNVSYDINGENAVVTFKYISDIVEQDYNGTYADTICTIDLNRYANVSAIELNSDVDDNTVTFVAPETLYGWDGNIPSEYANEKTIPDSIGGLDLDSLTTDLYEIININTEHQGQIVETPDDSDPEGIDETEATNTSEPSQMSSQSSSTAGSSTPRPMGIQGETYNGDMSGGTQDATQQVTDQTALNEHPETEENISINYVEKTIEFLEADNAFEIPADVYDTIEENETSTTALNITKFETYLKTDTDLSNSEKFINAMNTYGFVVFCDNREYNDFTYLYKYNGSDIEKISLGSNYQYHVDSEITSFTIVNDNNSDTNIFELDFNCIIPLYDIVDINYKSNFNTIMSTNTIELKSNSDSYITNVPLGMWFFTEGNVDEETNTSSIKLYKDYESGFAQSWSLTISSQFKPFPYSMNMPNEIYTNSQAGAYATFAQTLALQSEMINKFNDMMTQFEMLNTHIKSMESQLANIGTSYNIDNIHREFNNYEISMNNKFNALKTDLLTYLNNFKWHVTI